MAKSFIEKAFPNWALKREVARHNLAVARNYNSSYVNAGWNGGMGGRSRTLLYGSTDKEDAVGAWTRDDLISNSLDLWRNNPMAHSAVEAVVTYMGESYPHAMTDDKEWNKRATDYFIDGFWKFADARRRPGVDFGEFQNQFERWSWLGGDMIFVPFENSLLPYEGTQIRTPRELYRDKQIINGVRVMATAPYRISHYYLTSNAGGGKETFKRIRSNECFFAGSSNWRPAMIRSVPDLHAVVESLYSFGKTNANVQRRIEFESMLWTIERSGAIPKGPGSMYSTTGETKTETTPAEYGMRLKVNGDPDKDFKIAQMNNPQSNYVEVMQFMARQIGAGMGLPFEMIMHIFTEGSYNANRAARIDFAKTVMKRWRWRNKVFNQRIWNWSIAKAIKQGVLPPAPVDPVNGLSQWHKCAWTLPHFQHIDEAKEVMADIKQWGCGQESMEDWARQKGMTRKQLLDDHDSDIEECKARADKLGITLDMYMGQLFTAKAQANTAAAAVHPSGGQQE
jgi:hypothetical protein